MIDPQVRYLSAAPEGVTEVLLTGGLPPSVGDPTAANTAYRNLYRCPFFFAPCISYPSNIQLTHQQAILDVSNCHPSPVSHGLLHARQQHP